METIIGQLGLSDQHVFRYREVRLHLMDQEEQRAQVNTLTHNALFFQLEGELHISWDDNKDIVIKPGELYFLPRGANVSACMTGDEVRYVVGRFDHDFNNRVVFEELLKVEALGEQTSYSFAPLPIREPMQAFVEQLKRYLVDGIDNEQLHSMKFLELYLIFRHYYTKNECINLFYPILKENSHFKAYILDNYRATISITELVEKSNMSRSTFDRKFKESFGMTPLKWIDIQTRILILRKASEPNVSVKDIMYEVGVYNPSQFTKLCIRLCGVPPSKLIRR